MIVIHIMNTAIFFIWSIQNNSKLLEVSMKYKIRPTSISDIQR